MDFKGACMQLAAFISREMAGRTAGTIRRLYHDNDLETIRQLNRIDNAFVTRDHNIIGWQHGD